MSNLTEWVEISGIKYLTQQEVAWRIAELEIDAQRLTDLLDEGQSLVGDACSEPFTYAMLRLLGKWVNTVNAELYKQASEERAEWEMESD